VIEEMFGEATGGRHALDEDAFQTPIFHALSRGGLRRRQQDQAAESLEQFRRDPLTAPIPVQLVAPTGEVSTREVLGTPSREAGRAAVRAPREAPGRVAGRAAREAPGRAVARAAHEAAARSGAGPERADSARQGSGRAPRSGREWVDAARQGSGRAPRSGREWADSAREWSREWSAALAGRGRHHREPVPAHW
jgi:hypothetical protein